ncbi:hypothetical protein [Streptacidiphilus fuscans]|uniref:Uncharacterized protein n=1 Tax=Streptacidiphilus fuscans TaxID=2789292 RepID=A0A931B611_9ACTN|nr:hypothetical protein [Streptacidiphilus fuscans]MBF9070087.1 hypothetical protein [Streptacidiphilus fuscans]
MASLQRQPGRIRSGTQFVAITVGVVRTLAARLLSRVRRTPGPRGGPPTAGDRFPRRPKPTLPSDAIALSEPGSR